MTQFKTTSNRHSEITLANATSFDIDNQTGGENGTIIAVLEFNKSFYLLVDPSDLYDEYDFFTLDTIDGEDSDYNFKYNEDGTSEDTMPLGDRVFYTFDNEEEATEFIKSKQSI